MKSWKRITLKSLSEDTGVSKVTLHREIKRGNLIAKKHGGADKGGGRGDLRGEDIEAWAEKYFAD